MGISRACASKWVNRWRLQGDAGLQDRPSSPHRSPNATPAWVIEQIESWRREHKWSAQRITDELVSIGARWTRPADGLGPPKLLAQGSWLASQSLRHRTLGHMFRLHNKYPKSSRGLPGAAVSKSMKATGAPSRNTTLFGPAS
uniref:helix-turn-helix domain-containing protein n=1 Tax=Streptomyces sp. DG1A-41 TaxID=3125779 RepID=UPI00404008A6